MNRITLALNSAILLVASTPAIAEVMDDSAPQKTDSIEEVVVVASKIPRPLHRVASQVTTFHRDDLDRLQVQALGDIARYQPALEAEYEGNRFGATGISIRGIGGNRVAMEFDGVPMPKQFGIGEFASSSRNALDPAMIERIEVLRGPASSLYGSDAIGGVVIVESADAKSLLTNDDNLYLGGGGGWYGVDNSLLAYGTAAVESGTHGFILSLDRRQGSEVDNQAKGIVDDSSEHVAQHGLAKWHYEFDNGAELEGVLDIHQRNVDSNLRSILGFGRQYANTISLTGDDIQKRRRASVKYSTTDLAYVDHADLLVYFQSNETQQLTTDLRNNTLGILAEKIDRDFQFEERSRGIEAKFRKDLEFDSAVHILVAGVEWDHENLRESRDGLLTDLASNTTSKILPPGEVLPTRDLPTTDVDQFGAYVQDEIQLGRWTLIPALRWDRYVLVASTDQLLQDSTRLTDFDENNLNAKLGVTWTTNNGVTLYGHYSEGFRSPPAEDVNLFLDYAGRVLVRSLPNPDLKSEQSDNFELGLRFRGDAVKLELALYHSTYDNFIESRVSTGIDPVDGALLFQSRNISDSTIYGAEINTSVNPGDWFPVLTHWRAGLGFHWARGEDNDSGAAINSISPAKTNFNISWQASQSINAELRLSHYNEQRDVDFSNGAFFVPDAATTADLALSWSPNHWAEVHLGLNNITNRKYERYNDVRSLTPTDPRIEQLSRPGRNVAVTFHIRPK
tara:strand:- start:1038 stop:3242 length:2205 start_codon:yes stop_codon:yes gene_type:complete